MEFLNQGNFSMQNGNSHKHSPMIDKANRANCDSSEALVLQYRETSEDFIVSSMLESPLGTSFLASSS